MVDQSLEITISNNYEKDSIVRKGEGIGLKNVRSRLGIVYGRSDLIKIEDSDSHFKVKIIFPLEK